MKTWHYILIALILIIVGYFAMQIINTNSSVQHGFAVKSIDGNGVVTSYSGETGIDNKNGTWTSTAGQTFTYAGASA
jgi:hypothetical protein